MKSDDVNFAAFIFYAFAVWRMASLVAEEDGPGDVFMRLRELAGAYRVGVQSNLAKGIQCVWCVSMWLAIPFVALHVLRPKAAHLLALPFSLSAGAIVLQTVIKAIVDLRAR